MKFSAVIFDMDGLLINSERLALKAFQEICDHYEMGDQFGLYLQLLGVNRASSEKILAQQLDSHIEYQVFFQQWYERYHDLTKDGVPLMKGVTELLDHLDKIGISMAVATSTTTSSARVKLEKAGILHRFKTCLLYTSPSPRDRG